MKKLALATLLAIPVTAIAAVPADVTTAFGDSLVDVVAVAGMALIIVVALAAFRKMRSAVGGGDYDPSYKSDFKTNPNDDPW